MSEILVDTNVLVYAIDKGSKFHHWSKRILTDPKFKCFTTSKNLSEFFAVITRGDSPGLTPSEAIVVLKDIRSICTVLYPDPVSTDFLIELCEQLKPKGLLIHDFEIASISLSNQIMEIATVNKRDFERIQGLSIVSP